MVGLTADFLSGHVLFWEYTSVAASIIPPRGSRGVAPFAVLPLRINLVSAPSLPVAQLRQIDELCDRFEQAWQAGVRPAIEDYLSNATDVNGDDFFSALLSVELELRRAEQPLPDRTEYLRRFPDRQLAVMDAFG